MNTFFFLTIQVVLSSTNAVNATPQESFIKGNLSYGKGDYTKAIQHYNDGLNSGIKLGGQALSLFHYNLGNAHLRNGELGASIAAYLASYSERPQNEDLIANLEFARSQTQDDLAKMDTSPILKTLFFWHFAFGRSRTKTFFIGANALFWLLMCIQLFVKANPLIRFSQRFALVCTLLLGASVLVRWAKPHHVAVVQNQEINVYSGQDSASVIRFKLHEGSEIRAVKIEANWVKVDLPEQKQGWIRAKEVKIVQL